MPKITRVKAELKFTKVVKFSEKGEPISWKTLGLGAEGDVLANETYEMAQEELYHKVASELRLLFQERVDDTKPLPRQEVQDAVGDEEIEELPQPAPPVDPWWCEVHKAQMKKRSWGGYSHQVGKQWCQGHWCSEHRQPFKKFTDKKSGGSWWSHSYEDPDTGEALWCREDGEQMEIQ